MLEFDILAGFHTSEVRFAKSFVPDGLDLGTTQESDSTV